MTQMMLNGRRRNPDGTRNVYCKQCLKYVGTLNGAYDNFGSVSKCALCLAAEEGVEVPQEVFDSLQNLVRLENGQTVAVGILMPPPAPDPIIGTQSKEGWASYWGRVISTLTARAKTRAKELLPPSKVLAREKKKKRIFDRTELEQLIDEDTQ